MAFSSTSCVLSDEEVVSDAKERKSDATLLEYSDSESPSVNASRFAVSLNVNQGNSRTKELSWYWFGTS